MQTLAFPYTPEIAGTVLCYTITSELAQTWQELTKRHAKEDQRLPYYDLTQAFKFILGDFAAVRRGPQGTETLLLVRKQPPNGLIPRLFGAFEQALARRHNVAFQDRLAPLLSGLEPEEVRIGDYLTTTGPTGEPDIPKWVYDAVTWHATQLLSKDPVRLPSGRELRLRVDTEGNLLAWDDLLPDQKGVRRREPAMHYLSLTSITLPGQPGLVLSIDAHISRLTHFLPSARTVWIATDDNRLVLSAGFRYDAKTGKRILSGTIAELVDSFTLQGIPQLDDDILRREPDRVRARYHSTPAEHAVGSGPGRKFLDVVLNHAIACLPSDTAPLELVDSKIRSIDRSSSSPSDRVGLAQTLERSDARLHLTVLFASDNMRARAVGALARSLHLPLDDFGSKNTTLPLIPDHLKVTFRPVRKDILLTPGKPEPREQLAHDVKDQVQAGWIGAVLAETSAKAALAEGVPVGQDPKRQGRRAHAKLGIVSQHLDMASAPTESDGDHPADSALLDLLRSTGLTGTTPSRVFRSPLEDKPAVLVGIFSRSQNKPASRMVSLAAMVSNGCDDPWTTLAYHPAAGGWRPYPVAVAAHHADVLTPFDRSLSYEARTRQAAQYAQRALNQLLIRYPDLPIVLFLDGMGCRGLWQGLANRALGLATIGDLPHLGLPNASDGQIAVIRIITHTDNELPQPVRATTTGAGTPDELEAMDDHEEDDAFVPASTKLYKLASAKAAAYYLVNRSRTDQAFKASVRHSHRKTRFDPGLSATALRTPWHSMTCTELLVVDSADWTNDQLAALGARLCGHPLAWDGRTSRPAPLHLARQIIEDHPERR
jgi:hypothetical protein